MEEIRTVSKKVKKGIINKENEHKMLGTWFDETGDFGTTTNKRKKKMPFMITTVKKQANPRTGWGGASFFGFFPFEK